MGVQLLAFAGLAVSAYLILLVPDRWALFFTFLYIGLEGFFKVISNYHPVVHVGSDVVVIMLCLKVLYRIFFQGITLKEKPPFLPLFLIHFAWLAIVLLNPFALSLVSSIAGAKIYVTMILLYFFGFYLTEKEEDVRFFMIPFIIVGILHTVTGLVQGFIGPESVLLMHPRYAVQLSKYQDVAFRPFGLTNLPGGPSVYLHEIYPFLLYFMFHLRSYFAKLSVLLFLPFTTFLFFLCQIRSAMLKMIVGSSLFLLGSIHIASKISARMTQGLMAFGALAGAILFLTLPDFMDASVEARTENQAAIDRSLSLFDYETVTNARRGAWDRFAIYVKEVPLGAGFSRVGAAAGAFKDLHQADTIFGFKHFFSDNFWITTLIEIGLPGMVIMTLLLLMILGRGIRQYFNIEDLSLKTMHLAVLCSLIAIFIGLYGAEGVLYNPESSFFWFFAGVLMKIPKLEKKATIIANESF
ncbi:MAG: hypothetical protein KDD33_08995 [Bdellovibrionales bacterium]|nr:hypothetical protein [Bdellovibrionales bacterium]